MWTEHLHSQPSRCSHRWWHGGRKWSLAVAGQPADRRIPCLRRLHYWPVLDPDCCTLRPRVSACASFICGFCIRKKKKITLLLLVWLHVGTLIPNCGKCILATWACWKWAPLLATQFKKLLSTKVSVQIPTRMTLPCWSSIHRWRSLVSVPRIFIFICWTLRFVSSWLCPLIVFECARKSEASVSPQHWRRPLHSGSGLGYGMGDHALTW